MSRIAYILSAYKDAPHLARLIAALDDDADFYVHIDRKADDRPFRQLLEGKVTFVPSHWVSWGGWEQVEYQKELLGAVLRSGVDYGRVVCLSGQDYPLWSNEEIHRHFDEHPDTEFIMGLNLTRCTDRAQRSKIVCYHFFRDLKWSDQWWKDKLIVASRNLLKLLPLRKPHAGLGLGGGVFGYRHRLIGHTAFQSYDAGQYFGGAGVGQRFVSVFLPEDPSAFCVH